MINWFEWSGILIWYRVRGRLQWIFLRVNLNITIIKGMMIKSPHDRQNNRTGFGRRCIRFEVNWWRLAVTISWWLSWFIATNCVELVHISHKTGWEEVRDTDYTGISLVYNSSTEFSNNLLSNAENRNDWLESCCIIFSGIQNTKRTRAPTWIGQVSWGSKHLYITIDSMNVPPCVDRESSIVVKKCDEICHLGRN